MNQLGPAPTVARAAAFLEEAVSTTWRRLKDHQLKALPGTGTTRINLSSLVAFLNGGQDYEPTYKRGKKPGERRSGGKARRRASQKVQLAALSNP